MELEENKLIIQSPAVCMLPGFNHIDIRLLTKVTSDTIIKLT